MDKRTKKRIEVLRARYQKLQQILAGVKAQCDDPREIAEVEREMRETQDEITQLAAMASH
jgi:hypothetical protein